MNRSLAVATAMLFGLTTTLLACSGSDAPQDPCEKNPKKRGCSSEPTSAAPSSSATQYTTPAPTATPPAVTPVDAGADGPHKPDVGPLEPPQPTESACSVLLQCCGRVDDLIERGACLLAAHSGNESTCSNGIVTYQVAGGCGNIFGGGGYGGGGYGGGGYGGGGYGGGGYGGNDPCAYSSDPYCCDYYPSSPSCSYYP